MSEGITVQGGIGTMRASVDDLTWLKGCLLQISHELQEADAALRNLEFELNDNPAHAHAVMAEASDHVSEARYGSKGVQSLNHEAEQLSGALQLAMTTYSQAEDQIVAKTKKGFSWNDLYDGIRSGVSSVPLVFGIAAPAMSATTLTQKALLEAGWQGLVRDGEFDPAELLRKLHPAIEQYLSGFSLISGNFGPPNSTSISQGAVKVIDGTAGKAKPVSVTVDSRMTKSGGPVKMAEIVKDVGSLSNGRSGKPGQFAIEKVMTSSGVSWIVEIPGTQTMDLGRGSNPLDMYGNLMAVGQMPTQVGLAVTQAMTEAGAQPDEPVMLAGHSQGGIVASALANDSAFTSRFAVKSVVTFGSPISEIPVPDNVVTLSLQHDEDPIPTLSRAPNPGGPNHITVNRSLADSSVASEKSLTEGIQSWKKPLGPHGINSYERTATMVDNSNDPSIQAWREITTPFFNGQTSTRTVYTMKREE